jgi:hypothetical protein
MINQIIEAIITAVKYIQVADWNPGQDRMVCPLSLQHGLHFPCAAPI